MAALTAPRALAPLRHRGFRLLTIGQVTSNVGRPARPCWCRSRR
jgi:hypothetical protein